MIKKISILSAIILTLSGCASTQIAEKEVTAQREKVGQMFDQSYQKVPKNPLVTKDKGFWVNPSPIPHFEKSRKNLPDILLKEYVLDYPGDATLTEVIAGISSQTGILFEVSQDVYEPTGGVASVITSGGGAGSAASGGNTQTINPVMKNLKFNGPMNEMLNVLTAKLNLSWKWNGKVVEIFRYESKTFYLSALAGKVNTTYNINTTSTSGGGGGSGGGGSSQSGSSGQTMSLSFSQTSWDDAINYVRSMMSPKGRISVMESSGLILVRDTPMVLATVDKAITQLNALLSKPIAINVEVYSVVTSDSDSVGVDWTLAWSALSSKYNFGYTNSGANTSGTNNAISVGVTDGRFAGSGLTLSALSTIGKSSLVSNTQLTTLNGVMAPVLIANETSYIKSTTSTVNNGVTQTTIDPASITSGLGLQILPKVQANGNILLQTAISISDLERLDTFTSGTSTVQLPKRSLRNIVQASAIKSGQTLIISGFQNIASKVDGSGVGSPTNLLFGGAHRADNSKSQLVFMITPYLMD